MGKGPDTTTNEQTSTLPEYIRPYYQDLLTRAQTQSNQPYVPYGGPRLANFSSDTEDAFDMVRQGAQRGTGLSSAISDAEGGLGTYTPFGGPTDPITRGYDGNGFWARQTNTGRYTANDMVGTEDFDFQDTTDMDVDSYMNPYVSNVLDVNKQRADRRFQEQQVGRESDAVAAGAFGGDRRFVQDSLARRDFNEQMDTMNSEGMNAAFDRATGLFQADEGRRLQAHEGDQGRRLTADMDNARRRLQSYEGDSERRLRSDMGNVDRSLAAGMATQDARYRSSQLGLESLRARGDLSRLDQDMRFRDIEALSGVGSRIQGRNQGQLDLAYRDFLAQRDYPQQQLSLYSQLLSGTPVTPNTANVETGPTPDFLSQLLGLGTGAAGIWDLLQ